MSMFYASEDVITLPGESKLPSARAQNAPVTLKKLKVTRPPNTYLLLISFRSPDPELASDVANGIADSYIQHTYDIRLPISRSSRSRARPTPTFCSSVSGRRTRNWPRMSPTESPTATSSTPTTSVFRSQEAQGHAPAQRLPSAHQFPVAGPGTGLGCRQRNRRQLHPAHLRHPF